MSKGASGRLRKEKKTEGGEHGLKLSAYKNEGSCWFMARTQDSQKEGFNVSNQEVELRKRTRNCRALKRQRGRNEIRVRHLEKKIEKEKKKPKKTNKKHKIKYQEASSHKPLMDHG